MERATGRSEPGTRPSRPPAAGAQLGRAVSATQGTGSGGEPTQPGGGSLVRLLGCLRCSTYSRVLSDPAMPGRLQDKVCVVTGGTSGIGRDTVQRFIEEGARVVFCGRGEAAGNAIAAELGENCVFMKCDVMVEEEIEAVIEKAVELWGKLDVLFNNVCCTPRTYTVLRSSAVAG